MTNFIPTVRFMQFRTDEVDPGSTRHIENGSFAYVKTLGLGCTDSLDFGKLTLDASNFVLGSDTVAINFGFPDLFPSGLTAYNFRFYLPTGSGTALTTGSYLQYAVSGIWVQNPVFASGQGSQLPSTLLESPNVFRIDGADSINSFTASQISQYIYLRLFLDASHPTGRRGICDPSGTLLRLRLTFDYF